ncbi:MAG: universal stress protein [Actinomycetota bacterium]|nr:universal stress protein [Actinomycetota bacterium]MDQ2981027.1 universal stress protein [Actinomycetota bacterium]
MPFDRILVAIDGSECSDRALAKAVELAKLTGARLTALAVEGPLPAYAATIGEVDEVKREKDVFFNALAAKAREQAALGEVEIDIEVRPGHAAELISRVAAEGNYDLVVLGHRGHFLRDHLLGSTADRVVEHAPCPVMVVR